LDKVRVSYSKCVSFIRGSGSNEFAGYIKKPTQQNGWFAVKQSAAWENWVEFDE
jgi:hypothetical protein